MAKTTYFVLTCVVALMFYIAAPVFAQQPTSNTGSSNAQDNTNTQGTSGVNRSSDRMNTNSDANSSTQAKRAKPQGGTDQSESSSTSTSSTTKTQSGKNRSLPSTGSELQLVGLLGALSTTAGYLIRRFSK